jgi:hypothetical protein
MTVSELIEKLKNHDGNMIVVTSDWEGNYSDIEDHTFFVNLVKNNGEYYEAHISTNPTKIIKVLCI